MKTNKQITYLYKTDHGVDGWDAETIKVAKFSTKAKAIAYIAKMGYTYYQYGAYYHHNDDLRNTMGCISFEIKTENIRDLPLNPV